MIDIEALKEGISTPSLIVDKNTLQKNINKMSIFAKNNNISIRPHAKSHKIPLISKLQIREGAIGICVATLFEAEIMVKNNIHGILLTAPITNKNDQNRLKLILQKSKQFSLVIDNVYSINYLTKICSKNNLKCNVLIDCDIMSIGKNKIGRTGARNIQEILKLSQLVQNSSFLNYMGICAYAGDLQHINAFNSRHNEAKIRYQYLKKIIDNLESKNLKPKIISGGGTGSHYMDTLSSLFTELQPGSYIFGDVEYDNVDIYKSGNPYKPSLFVASSVISRINEKKFIINAGLKAFSTDSKYLPKPSGNLPIGTQYNFMGDEHGLISLPAKSKKSLKLGETILIQPPHCDPTINLYDQCNIYDKKKTITQKSHYRDIKD